MAGLGYQGQDQNGEHMWGGASNVDIGQVEVRRIHLALLCLMFEIGCIFLNNDESFYCE